MRFDRGARNRYDRASCFKETWPRGRRHSPAKGADGQNLSRGFESLRLRQDMRKAHDIHGLFDFLRSGKLGILPCRARNPWSAVSAGPILQSRQKVRIRLNAELSGICRSILLLLDRGCEPVFTAPVSASDLRITVLPLPQSHPGPFLPSKSVALRRPSAKRLLVWC